MISVNQALQLISSHSLPREVELVDLKNSLGKVLAEPIRADRDAPPFDRVAMDGIALSSASLATQTYFKIENIQAAGAEKVFLKDKTGCIEVMTGAILPGNTDSVIPYEQIDIQNGLATLINKNYATGRNIHFQGTDALSNDILVKQGKTVTPAVISILASVGMVQVKVVKMPRVAVCSTGNELVAVSEQPQPHQIRRSNSYMLEAALSDLGIPCELFHLTDNKEEMSRQLSSMLKEYPLLLFSGAVSKGKYDYLPVVLEELGMQQLIHGVAQRPGKPFLFGTLSGTILFGFPGNPASTFACFHIYFKPWLRQHLGLPDFRLSAVLDQEVEFKPPLTFHLPVRLSIQNGLLSASPVSSSGSGDLVHLAQADALLSLPSEKSNFKIGESYPVNLFRKDLFF